MKMKMTDENLGRLLLTSAFFGAAILTAIDHRASIHIAFSLAGLILLAKVIYSYVKGI